MVEVKVAILNSFERTLWNVHDEVKISRMMQDNQLVKEKCKKGPVIHNFTEYEVHEELSKFMEDGLGNVPEMTIDRVRVVTDIDGEIKNVCFSGWVPSKLYFYELLIVLL